MVFQEVQLPNGTWEVDGKLVRPADIKQVALFTIEGELDDIRARPDARGCCARTSRPTASSTTPRRTAATTGFFGWREMICPKIAEFIRHRPERGTAAIARGPDEALSSSPPPSSRTEVQPARPFVFYRIAMSCPRSPTASTRYCRRRNAPAAMTAAGPTPTPAAGAASPLPARRRWASLAGALLEQPSAAGPDAASPARCWRASRPIASAARSASRPRPVAIVGAKRMHTVLADWCTGCDRAWRLSGRLHRHGAGTRLDRRTPTSAASAIAAIRRPGASGGGQRAPDGRRDPRRSRAARYRGGRTGRRPQTLRHRIRAGPRPPAATPRAHERRQTPRDLRRLQAAIRTRPPSWNTTRRSSC